MTRGFDTSVTRIATAAVLAVLALLAAAPADSPASVRTAATEHLKGELVKTIPISQNPWGAARSAFSIGPSKLGELRAGDRLEAFGEVELTICLKPAPGHPGQPCVGNVYGYNPTLEAKVVLGPEDSSSGAGTMQIGKSSKLVCRQDHPVRNRHCVLDLPWSGTQIADPSQLPCEPSKCFLNLVVSAHHPDARAGELAVVGSSDDQKRIHQGRGKLSMARYRGSDKPDAVWRTGKIHTRKIPVGSKAGSVNKRVIHSLRIGKVKAGDQLVVDAKSRSRIGHLPYNVFQRSELVLTSGPNSITQAGKIVDSTARISASNGFNCTLKRSAHPDPCTTRKGGVLSIGKSSSGPWFVNLVVRQNAIGTSKTYRKWRSGHASKTRKGGFIKVERYSGGTGTCKTCATGWTEFGPNLPVPGDSRQAKLVSQINGWGIDRGRYNCKGRTKGPSYVCKWEASGRFGDSPRYECKSKGFWRGDRFEIKPCKDAIGAQLWDQIVRKGMEPTFAGSCKELGGGDFRCKWFAKGDLPSPLGESYRYFCKAEAVYRHGAKRWDVDRCKSFDEAYAAQQSDAAASG